MGFRESRGCRSLRAPLPYDSVGHDGCARGGHALLVSGPGLVSCPRRPPGDKHRLGFYASPRPRAATAVRTHTSRRGPTAPALRSPAPMAEWTMTAQFPRSGLWPGSLDARTPTALRSGPKAPSLSPLRSALRLKLPEGASEGGAVRSLHVLGPEPTGLWTPQRVPHARGRGVRVIRAVSHAGLGWLRPGGDRRPLRMGVTALTRVLR